MPLRNNAVVCINHPDLPMTRSLGYSALTKVDTTGDLFNFKPDTGIPVLVFYCEVCGYVESYIAPKTGYWEADHPANDAIDPKHFEQTAFNSLETIKSSFGISELSRNVRVDFPGNQIVEFDAIGKTSRGILIFEFKSSTSTRQIEAGASTLTRLMTLYKSNFPKEKVIGGILVAPSLISVGDVYFGAPILKVNLQTGEIENLSQLLSIVDLNTP